MKGVIKNEDMQGSFFKILDNIHIYCSLCSNWSKSSNICVFIFSKITVDMAPGKFSLKSLVEPHT